MQNIIELRHLLHENAELSGKEVKTNAILNEFLEKLNPDLHIKNIGGQGIAVMNRPDLTADGMIVDHHVEPIKNKIRTIFRLGLIHRHDSLVLGALGCGAFCNPPRHVARLFHEVMEEQEFKNRYRRILFAILDDHNAHQRHNPEGNFKPFVEEFV